ncbi:MAG: AAA family ATPase [Pseudonocardiaceae bacterium]|nr:AAA family ATPase [Pseudonocardiaceae bacterium]
MVPTLCPVIVGRDSERAKLRAMLQAAAHGRGATVALLGEAGVGKTRLVRELTERAQAAGMPVLVGRAVEGAPCPALHPLVEALLAGLRSRPLSDLADLASFRPALGRLLPPLRTEQSGLVEESMPVLSEGVLRLLRALAGRSGLLLICEDMQWADVETLAVLEYLAAQLRDEPVLIVITVRRETAGQGLDLAHGLQARAGASAIELDRLDEAGVAGMVRACLDSHAIPEDVLSWLSERAEGLPFLVEELLASAITSEALRRDPGGWSFSSPTRPVVPVGFADSVHRRLATAGDATDWVMRCAAVLGRVFDARLLPELAGQSRDAVAASLRRAAELQLVTRHDGVHGTHRFRHALTYEALLADLPGYQRSELAGTALKIVEEAWPGLPDGWCMLAAQLAEQADDHSRAAALLLESGSRALASGALSTAQHALEQARGHATTDEPTLARIEQLLLRGPRAGRTVGAGRRCRRTPARRAGPDRCPGSRTRGRTAVTGAGGGTGHRLGPGPRAPRTGACRHSRGRRRDSAGGCVRGRRRDRSRQR